MSWLLRPIEPYTPEIEKEGFELADYFDKAVAEHELCNCNYCKERKNDEE